MAVAGARLGVVPDLNGSWDTVTIYDVATWKPSGVVQRPLRGEAGRHIPALAFSPDGRLLALVSWDRTVRLLHVPGVDGRSPESDSWTEAAHFVTDGELRALAFSPDAAVLAMSELTRGDAVLMPTREQR